MEWSESIGRECTLLLATYANDVRSLVFPLVIIQAHRIAGPVQPLQVKPTDSF